MEIVIALPLLVILVLIGFSFIWLLHHHFFKPVLGIIFILGGLFFFSLLSYPTAERAGMPVQEAVHNHELGRETTPPPFAEASPEPAGSTSAATSANGSSDAARPSWVGQPPKLENWDGKDVYVVSVTSGPYETLDECKVALVPAIEKEVREYAEKLDPEAARAQPLVLNDSSMLQRLIHDKYQEVVHSSVGVMQQLDAQLAFTDQLRAELISRLHNAVVEVRLKYTAAAGAILLLVLGVVYSLLRGAPKTPQAHTSPTR